MQIRGITPAGAGKTWSGVTIGRWNEDHPRRCGENYKTVKTEKGVEGSPPQVRGKQTYSAVQSVSPGITPAGAGKTHTEFTVKRIKQDHPRRCGENGKKAFPFAFGRGSPPQVRGKRHMSQLPFIMGRITPAGAGKTYREGVRAWTARDHPRRCGENQFIKQSFHNNIGSPPQVRGKPIPTV